MRGLPLVLTVPDVCGCTGMSRYQVLKYVDAGALPSLPRVKGEHVLIPRAALAKFLGEPSE